MLNRYVRFVLEDAVDSGIERLYFLARDGWLMYELAKKLCAEQKNVPKLGYLKVSRLSLRRAEYSVLDDETILDYVFGPAMNITFESLMERTGLNTEEISYLKGVIAPEHSPSERVGETVLKQWKSRAEKSEEFFKIIRKSSSEILYNVRGYLIQEGLADDARCALCDSGWTGTIQRSIKNILQTSKPQTDISGYYFGLYSIPESSDANAYKTYFFEPGKNARKKMLFCNNLFEALCAPDQGMTIGYVKKADGEFVPVEKRGKKNAHYEAVRELHERAMLIPSDANVQKNADKKAAGNFLRAMSHPNKTELELYGGIEFCDDLPDNKPLPLANPVSPKSIGRELLIPKIRMRLRGETGLNERSAWPEGSVKRLYNDGRIGLIRAETLLLRIRLYKYVSLGIKGALMSRRGGSGDNK